MAGNYSVTDTGNQHREGAFRFRGVCHLCGFQTHQAVKDGSVGTILKHLTTRHNAKPKEVVKSASKVKGPAGGNGDSGAQPKQVVQAKQGAGGNVPLPTPRVLSNVDQGTPGTQKEEAPSS